MFSQDWPQEILAVLVCLAALYFLIKPFRSKKPPAQPDVQLGRRLQSGLQKAENERKKK